MKKELFVFFVTGTILTLSLNEKIAYADESTKKESAPTKENNDDKSEALLFSGKLVKSGEDYILLNKEHGGIVMPHISDKNSSVNYDDWLGKFIEVSGKGTIDKIEREGSTKLVITYTTVTSIKSYEQKK